MKLRSKLIAPIIVLAFAGGISMTIALDLWKTETIKDPAKYQIGEFAGEYNPADIRGSYSFGDIEKAFKIPVTDLAKAFGLDGTDNPEAVVAGDLKLIYPVQEEWAGEIGTDSVKLFVALYLGLPFEPEHETLLPAPALPILKDKLSEENLEEVEAATVAISEFEPAAVVEELTKISPEDSTIKGNTTYQDLINWGLSIEEIVETIGIEIENLGISMRDHLEDAGIAFSTAKAKLQEILDSKR